MAVSTRLVPDDGAAPHGAVRQGALELSRAMPRLVLEARRAANTLAHGLHGRRRVGPGETFWQFRRYDSSEAANRVDWRRSARDDHLYVREREWEAVRTFWLWADRSASMGLVSSLATAPKVERAMVVTLALADILVRGGERVGFIGLGPVVSSRSVVEILAERIVLDETPASNLPAPVPLAPGSEAVLIGDFLDPPGEIEDCVRRLASRGATGHLLAVTDPIEEDLPFDGRSELVDPETGGKLTFGRIETVRDDYRRRLAAHRAEVTAAVRKFGWSFAVHHTDRPASDALMSLYSQFDTGGKL